MSSSRRRNLVLALCLAAGMLGPRFAHAAIVERVVAIVGERPILLSDLRHRAQPFLHRILAAQLSPAQQAAQETAMFKELVNQLIDDRLVEHAADQAHVSVTPDEIDSALQNVAARSKRSVPQLLLEAVRRGLTEQDYRDEIRRQILLGRLVQLRVRGRVRVTDEDTRATYDHWAREFETQHPVDVRIIAMRLPRGATEATLSGRLKVAEQVVKRARNGEDYCSLVRQFSDEPGAGDTCGSPGLQPLNVLHGPIQDAVRRMRQGETSDPILFGNDTIVVVQVASQPKVLPFEQLKQEMTDMAFEEAMEHQTKLWLSELRRGVYVDIRL